MFKCYWHAGENTCTNATGDEHGGCIRGIGYPRPSSAIPYTTDKCPPCKQRYHRCCLWLNKRESIQEFTVKHSNSQKSNFLKATHTFFFYSVAIPGSKNYHLVQLYYGTYKYLWGMRSFAFNTVKNSKWSQKNCKVSCQITFKKTALGPDFACTCACTYNYVTLIKNIKQLTYPQWDHRIQQSSGNWSHHDPPQHTSDPPGRQHRPLPYNKTSQ